MTTMVTIIITVLTSTIITYLINFRSENINTPKKKKIRAELRDYYTHNCQRYTGPVQWLDIYLDYCEDNKITKEKDMEKIWKAFPKGFMEKYVGEEINV